MKLTEAGLYEEVFFREAALDNEVLDPRMILNN